MHKRDLVTHVAEHAKLSDADAKSAVDAVLAGITESLARGEEVAIAGFGKFTVSERAAREGVNPRDPSQRVQIPARRVPAFRAGASLKEAVAG